MHDLTQRQVDILRAIIMEYSETGEAVGSEIMDKKYKLGVSPATIRNEMVALAGKGYLRKDHFSSGRVPSAKGFRFYINHLMKEKPLSIVDEVAYKNSIWDDRETLHRLLSHATRVLAARTGMLAITATSEGEVYSAGVSNLINQLKVSKAVCELCDTLDEMQFWQQVIQKHGDGDLFFLLGEEDFSDPMLEPVASVMGEFTVGEVRGIIGLVGPKGMAYDIYAPQVRYFSHLIESIAVDQS